ncbi:MAG: hypothetical protein PUB32_04340 [Clostridiales bacterium]|nr:hypothetical protein [Clostridiales bacterium]
MGPKFLKRSALLSVISILVVLSALSASTYAWFTANRSVSTSRIEARTGYEELTLYVKAPSDSAFTGNVCELSFTGGSSTALMPVSTADLQHFVYCPNTAADRAERFLPVGDLSNQTLFCYGTVHMRAELEGGADSSARVAVYLDQSDEFGLLAEKSGEDSLLLNAARLGLAIHGEADTAKIFYLSDEENDESGQVRNTFVDGQLQPDDIVLKSDGSGQVTAVTDPALPLSACMLSAGSASVQPLFYLEPGVDYVIDVFFYLEGCDPDCSDSIAYDAADFGLAFYATLESEG